MSSNSAEPATTRDRVRFGLHAGQIAPWQSPARFKVVVSGRRWGKTLLGRTWLLAQALRGCPGRYWYVGPTREDAKDTMWADLKAACDPRWLTEPPREQDLALHLLGGKEVRIFSAEKHDALRGRPLRALVMDEYADMAPEMFFEVLRPSLSDYKAPALFIGTPKSHNHFYELFLRGSNPSYPTWASWQYRSIDNPFLDPREIEDARSDMDARSFRQEYEASFEAMAGRAYCEFSRALDVRPVTLELSLPVCVSFDFNVNPATAVIGQRHHDACRVWREVFLEGAGGAATRESAATVRRFLDQVGYRGPVRLYGDATGTAMKTTGPSDHQVIREMFPGASWHLARSNPHPRDRVAAVNARCCTSDGKRHLTVDPTCTRLIGDFEQVVFDARGELDQKTNPLLTHVSDAFGYWVWREWPPVRRVTAGVAHIEALI